MKGIRMDAAFIARIERTGSVTGIRSFSEQVRYLVTLGLAKVEQSRKAA